VTAPNLVGTPAKPHYIPHLQKQNNLSRKKPRANQN